MLQLCSLTVIHKGVFSLVIRSGLSWLWVSDTARVPVAHLLQDGLICGRGQALAQDPWVLHDLIATQTRVWVSNEQFANKVLGAIRDRGPGRRIEIVLTLLNLFEERKVVLIIERWRSRKQDEEHDANAPKVAGLLVWTLLENLRSYIAWCATGRRGQLLVIDEASQSEV